MRPALPAIVLTLILSSAAEAQQIRGRIIEVASGAPVSDAALTASDREGIQRARTASDADGRFVLPLPFAGEYTLGVEHIGYSRLETEPFAVAPGELIDVEVRVATGVIPLEPLVVRGRESQPLGRVREFYDRAERGGRTGDGRFIDREELERYPASTVTMLIARTPGVRIRPVGPDYGVFMRGPTGECAPAVFIDGIEASGFNTMIDAFATPESLEGVEVYRSALQTPVEYRRNTSCGAVLLWSRQGQGDRPFSWKRVLIGAGGFLLLILTVGNL